MRHVLLAAALLSITVAANCQKIDIRTPRDGAAVPYRPMVEGSVSPSNAAVWVVVHPIGISDYYVQPVATVRKNGAWRTEVYIGRDGAVDVGKRFEIIAFMNPRQPLTEGPRKNWPEAQARSDVVEVVRK